MKIIKGLLLLVVFVTLAGCDWPWDDDDDVDVTSGTGEVAVEQTKEYVYTTEYGKFAGRTNGDRPTWYFSKRMSSYPSKFMLTVEGCRSDISITNNGSRYESGIVIVKQSDVAGRGMAVVYHSSCKSETAYVVY